MPQFDMFFVGRRQGAIGSFQQFHEVVNADDWEQARLKLYLLGYEHIHLLSHTSKELNARLWSIDRA